MKQCPCWQDPICTRSASDLLKTPEAKLEVLRVEEKMSANLMNLPWRAVQITESCTLCWMIIDRTDETVVDGLDGPIAEHIVNIVNDPNAQSLLAEVILLKEKRDSANKRIVNQREALRNKNMKYNALKGTLRVANERIAELERAALNDIQ